MNLKLSVRVERVDVNSLALAYMIAKEHVIKSGYADEIDWQSSLALKNVDETTFLRESAWVIVSVGMSAFIIRSLFGEISRAFLWWRSAEDIMKQRSSCKRRALAVFGNVKKVEAIDQFAEIVAKDGFDHLRQHIEQQGVRYIRRFPFMGPATAFHLAKNLGLNVVKPDRHLLRVAAVTGYSTPYEMCSDISRITYDKLAVIDLVIWRFATLKKNYLDLFCKCSSHLMK